eukprot:scaffold120489_cov74-Phaeocystis_antarctica.AAC.1
MIRRRPQDLHLVPRAGVERRRDELIDRREDPRGAHHERHEQPLWEVGVQHRTRLVEGSDAAPGAAPLQALQVYDAHRLDRVLAVPHRRLVHPHLLEYLAVANVPDEVIEARFAFDSW